MEFSSINRRGTQSDRRFPCNLTGTETIELKFFIWSQKHINILVQGISAGKAAYALILRIKRRQPEIAVAGAAPSPVEMKQPVFRITVANKGVSSGSRAAVADRHSGC